jgi:ABC-type lipoprotein release transport system permease subunit
VGFLVSFALRNLGRHLRRTIITAGALAVGLGVFLFFDSTLKGADADSERNLIWYETGAARIVTPEAAAQPDKPSLKNLVLDPAAVVALVKNAGFEATLRTRFEAEVTTTGSEDPASQVVRATALDPATDSKVFSDKKTTLKGRWFGTNEPAVVLGAWLAADLGTAPGQTLTLTTRTKDGSYQVLDLDVVGTVETPDPSVNRGGVFVPLAYADEQLGLAGGVTDVAVGWPLGTDTAAARAKIQAGLKAAGVPLSLLTWRDLAQGYLALSAAKQKSSGLMILLVIIIAAVGVGNTFLLAFYERKTEIGMLRALGMADNTLFRAFLVEATGIGVIGSILGLVFGAILVGWMTTFGMDFSALSRQTDIGYPVAGVLYGVWDASSFVVAGILGVVLSALLVIGPTRRALKLPITESLRAEG